MVFSKLILALCTENIYFFKFDEVLIGLINHWGTFARFKIGFLTCRLALDNSCKSCQDRTTVKLFRHKAKGRLFCFPNVFGPDSLSSLSRAGKPWSGSSCSRCCRHFRGTSRWSTSPAWTSPDSSASFPGKVNRGTQLCRVGLR